MIYVCTRCGCLWREWAAGSVPGVLGASWSLFNGAQAPCVDCDNSPFFLDVIVVACDRAPSHWQCKRKKPHTGPCAAVPV